MGFFSSLGAGLSNIGSSVGDWLSNPANQDKLNAWGQELNYLGNPGGMPKGFDPSSIYETYKKHQQHDMSDGTAASPDGSSPSAPEGMMPLQSFHIPQIPQSQPWDPNGVNMPSAQSVLGPRLPRKLGGY